MQALLNSKWSKVVVFLLALMPLVSLAWRAVHNDPIVVRRFRSQAIERHDLGEIVRGARERFDGATTKDTNLFVTGSSVSAL